MGGSVAALAERGGRGALLFPTANQAEPARSATAPTEAPATLNNA